MNRHMFDWVVVLSITDQDVVLSYFKGVVGGIILFSLRTANKAVLGL